MSKPFMSPALVAALAPVARSAYEAASAGGATEQASYRAAAGAVFGVLSKEGEGPAPWEGAVWGQVEMKDHPEHDKWHAFSRGVAVFFMKEYP